MALLIFALCVYLLLLGISLGTFAPHLHAVVEVALQEGGKVRLVADVLMSLMYYVFGLAALRIFVEDISALLRK